MKLVLKKIWPKKIPLRKFISKKSRAKRMNYSKNIWDRRSLAKKKIKSQKNQVQKVWSKLAE